MKWFGLVLLGLWPWLFALRSLLARRRALRSAEIRARHVWLFPGEAVIRPPNRECTHWPRTPVLLADGTQVSGICCKCDATVYHQPYVTALDVAR